MTQTTCNLPWVCNALSSMDPADNNCIESTGGYFPPALSNCIAIGPASSGRSMVWSVQSTLWLTFYSNFDNVGSNGSLANGRTLIQWLDGATVVAQIVLFGGVGSLAIQYQFQSLQGGVMTAVGSVTLAVTGSTPANRFDVQLTGNTASGVMAVYVAGTQQINGTGLNHAGWSGTTQIVAYGAVASIGTSYFSSFIADSTTHVGDTIRRYPIDTASAVNTGYTGAVSNINELVTNDTTFVYATANGQIGTYYASGFNLGSLNIVAVAVAARTKPSGTLAHIELAIRTSATNYVSSSISLPSAGYQGTCNAWTTNPNTSAAWVTSAAQAIEGGMEAIT